jgi:clumping factor A
LLVYTRALTTAEQVSVEDYLGTKYNLPTDSDGDGMPDDWETEHGFNPYSPSDAALDSDGDGLRNVDEYLNGTNPFNIDSDGDGMPDGYEVQNGLNPLINDSTGDLDHDGSLNYRDARPTDVTIKDLKFIFSFPINGSNVQ